MKEINILDIENIKIGNAQNNDALTGCTLILCEKGAPCGVYVAGGGPASRETNLLNPMAAAEKIHAVLLSGGSAFGLDSAGGVMEYLEEKDIGFDTGVTKVPLVCTSCIFDLGIGSKNVRPDKKMGYECAKNAYEENNYKDGNYGVGCGATAGKLLGKDFMTKTGVGSYAVQIGDLKVGAVVCVNALGDVFDDKGNIIAGLLNSEKDGFLNTFETMIKSIEPKENLFTSNTTIGAVITNASFDKTKMNKIARMAHNGYVKRINPINTTADGDSIYALSTGDVISDINVVGSISSFVVEMAIERAIKSAKGVCGVKSYNEMQVKK